MVTATQVDVAQGRATVSAAATWLVGLRESMFAVGNAELGPFFRQVDDLSRQVEAAQVAILSEALSRGVVAGSDCPTATAWVIQWAPSFRAGGAAQLVTVGCWANPTYSDSKFPAKPAKIPSTTAAMARRGVARASNAASSPGNRPDSDVLTSNSPSPVPSSPLPSSIEGLPVNRTTRALFAVWSRPQTA